MIAVLGGGPWVARYIELAARACPGGGELRLAARRFERTEIIARHAEQRIGPKAGNAWSLRACRSIDEAIAGARVVVIMVRAGGLAARAHDETFPRAYGLAGDEGLGPGGVANGYRSVPLMSEIARAIHSHAPRAAVINLVAPLGITTRVLIEEGLDAVGVCELPRITEETLACTELAYGGLNHVGWFWPGEQIAVNALVDPIVRERFGAVPLRYYYEVFDREAAKRLGIEDRRGRAKRLEQLGDTLIARYANTPGVVPKEMSLRAMPWIERALVPITAARLGGAPDEGFANVRNSGCRLIPELPESAIVEVRARTNAFGTEARPAIGMPRPVVRFLARLAGAEDLAYRAARERSPALVKEAIRALPLPIAESALDGIVRAAVTEVGTS